MSIERRSRGTVIPITVEFKDRTGTYIDPTSPKITIYNPDGSVRVGPVDYVKDEVGKYHYNFQSLTSDLSGYYEVKTTAESAADATTYTVLKRERLFLLNVVM